VWLPVRRVRAVTYRRSGSFLYHVGVHGLGS
jgi:hypothetical protein